MIRAVFRMRHNTRLTLTVLLIIIGSSLSADLEFCEDGHQIAQKYNQCWTESQFLNNRVDVDVEVYTAKFVEEYARHMCSVVKPQAMECLRKEIAECSNSAKLLEMADESGGTCIHNDLNSFFKLHIIDHLTSVRKDSICVTIARDSHCSHEAIKKFKKKRVPISRYHYEADTLFTRIWECQVKLFKSKLEVCKNWQLPMLLSLQYMAMPTLFGMKLTEDHVAMLELEKVVPQPRTTVSPITFESESKFYILLKVLSQKPNPSDGDIVLQVDIGENEDATKNSIKVITGTDNKTKKPNKQQKTKKPPRKE